MKTTSGWRGVTKRTKRWRYAMLQLKLLGLVCGSFMWQRCINHSFSLTGPEHTHMLTCMSTHTSVLLALLPHKHRNTPSFQPNMLGSPSFHPHVHPSHTHRLPHPSSWFDKHKNLSRWTITSAFISFFTWQRLKEDTISTSRSGKINWGWSVA